MDSEACGQCGPFRSPPWIACRLFYRDGPLTNPVLESTGAAPGGPPGRLGPVRVALGSESEVKRRALLRALSALGARAELVALPVPGAPAQPLSETATEEGAAFRAWYAKKHGHAELGVGLEGGVDLDSGWLTMYAAATDGERLALGRGPSVPLPEEVLAALRQGAELGPYLRERFGAEAARKGAVWVFSGGAMTREEALAAAARLALGPFLGDTGGLGSP